MSSRRAAVQLPQAGKRSIFTGGHHEPIVKHGTAIVTRPGKTLTVVFALKPIGKLKARVLLVPHEPVLRAA